MPTETPRLTIAATADQPVNLDVFANGWGEPEYYAAAIGDGATASVNAAQVTPGVWAADIGQSGPACAVKISNFLTGETLADDVVLWYRVGALHEGGDLDDCHTVGPMIVPVGDWSP